MVACPTNQELRGNHWDTVCVLRLCIPPVVRRVAKFEWDCNHIRWSTSDTTTTHETSPSVASQSQPHLEDGSVYRQNRPTVMDSNPSTGGSVLDSFARPTTQL